MLVPLLSAAGNQTAWAEAFAGFLLSRLAIHCVTSVPAPIIAPTLAASEGSLDEEVFRCGLIGHKLHTRVYEMENTESSVFQLNPIADIKMHDNNTNDKNYPQITKKLQVQN